MVNRSWAQNGCYYRDDSHVQCIQVRSLQRSSNCQSLVRRRNKGKSCKMWCLCRKVSNHSQHKLPFSRFMFIVQKSHGPDCPVAGARVFLRHAPSTRVCNSSTSAPVKPIHFAPIVIEAICDNTAMETRGCQTCPSSGRRSLALYTEKFACALFQSLLSRTVSGVALTISPLISTGVRASACWMSS